MVRVWKDPLLHCLLIGMCLFLVYGATSRKPQDDDRSTIGVDREALLGFLQFRSRAFEREHFSTLLDGMGEGELKELIDEYVREEALYREATALQLDENDYVLRQRVIQKLEFATRSFVSVQIPLSQTQVQRYFEEHAATYYVEPQITFTHVFFEERQRDGSSGEARARRELRTLNDAGIPFVGAPSHGDRFLYHVNYVARTPGYVASHFGSKMAQELFALEVDEQTWRGPLRSLHGYHLVMVTRRVAGQHPALDEIAERVTGDAERAALDSETEAEIQKIIDTYQVEIANSLRDPGKRKSP